MDLDHDLNLAFLKIFSVRAIYKQSLINNLYLVKLKINFYFINLTKSCYNNFYNNSYIK